MIWLFYRIIPIWVVPLSVLLSAGAHADPTPRLPLPVSVGLGAVHTLQVVGNYMYIGGDFSDVGGLGRDGLAAIDLTNGSVDTWAPSLLTGAVVHKLQVSADKKTLYVAGEFETVSQQVTYKNVAKINIDSASTSRGQFISDWHPDVIGGPVKTLVISPDERLIYLGGGFTQIDGVNRQYLAAVDLQESQITPWQPEPDAPVNKLYLSDDGSEVYVAGRFSVIGGAFSRDTRQGLAIVKASNGGVLDWDVDIQGGTGEVYDFLLSEDKTIMYVAGDFTDAGGQTRNNIVALDLSDATALSNFDPDANGPVRALAYDHERLYLAGDFTALNAGVVLRSHLAALDLLDERILSWAPAINTAGVVNALHVDAVKDELLIGGDFLDIASNTNYQDMAVFAIAPPVTTAVSVPSDTIALQDPFEVSLKCVDNTGASCAKIFYTNDKSEPTHNGLVPTMATQVYASETPIQINSNTTVKFFAVDADGNREFVQAKKYYVDDVAPTTTVTLAEGWINAQSNVPVELRCNDGVNGSGCVTTLYSLDGSVPSIPYTAPFPLADQATLETLSEITLQYHSTDLADNLEDIKTAVYTIDVVPPKLTVSDGGGNYVGSLTVTVTCEDSSICTKLAYTLDGTNPLELEPSDYDGPITLTFSEGTMLRVYAEDSPGNVTEGLLGVYTFTSAEREHTRGIGGLTTVWLLLLLPLAWRRLQRKD